MINDLTIFLTGSLLALVALVIHFRANNNSSAIPAELPSTWPLVAVLSIALFYFLTGCLRGRMHLLIGGDEYCRSMHSITWSKSPFFALPDHLWLSGQFYVLGTLLHVFKQMPYVVAFSSLLGTAAIVYFAASLARRVWGSTSAGFFAAAMVGSELIILWASCNPLAEVFSFPAFLAALDSWVAGWQAQANDDSISPRRSELYFLRAAAWLAFGSMFRYEAWYPIMVLGVFLCWRCFCLLRRANDRHLAWIPLVGCLVMATYPLAWMISSNSVLGSPLAFLHNAIAGNLKTNILYDFSNRLAITFSYPIYLWLDHWPRLALPAGGVAIALLGRRKGAKALVAALFLVLLAAILATCRSGLGSNTRARYTEFLVLPLLSIGAGPIALLWTASAGWKRLMARSVVAVFLSLAIIASASQAAEQYVNGWSLDNRSMGVLSRFEHEHDFGRPAASVFVQNKRKGLEIYSGNIKYFPWMVAYHSRWPKKVRNIYDTWELKERFKQAPKGTHFLVARPRPAFDIPDGVKLLEVMEPFELWEVTAKRHIH